MKREIKFRAWVRRLDKMCNVTGIDFERNEINILRPGWHMSEWFRRDQVELMQYTGLKDVDDTEIYEGDIMRAVPVRRQYPTAFSLKEHVGTLVIGSQRLTISGKTYDKELYDYEVIGNKFQNPELLEAD